MTHPGIEPRSSGPLANILKTKKEKIIFLYANICKKHLSNYVEAKIVKIQQNSKCTFRRRND